MIEGHFLSSQVGDCLLARKNPALFSTLVAEYREIVQLAVEQVVSRNRYRVLPKIRALAYRAGAQDAVPQDLIAVHLSALAILVKKNPNVSLARAWVQHGRLLLVKMIGELALYYRDEAAGRRSGEPAHES